MPNQNHLKQKLKEGLHLHQAGRLQDAEKLYREVLLNSSDDPDAHHFLGLIAHQLGDFDEAVRLISRAIELEAGRPTFHFNLGASLMETGRRSDAISAYKIAAQLKPDWPEAHYNLGSILGQSGNVELAETSLRRAVELQPTYHEALSNLAAILTTQGKLDQASDYCRQAVELAPKFSEAWTNWGNALEKLERHDEAEAAHRKATVNNPDYAVGHYNLGNLLTNFWRPDEAAQCYRNALDADPQYVPARDNLLMNLLYDPKSTEASLYEEHVKWDGQSKISNNDQGFHNNRNPDRRLRIGYVSPDFRTHSCASFLEPLFSAHNPQQVEVFAYANVARPDKGTKSLKRLVDQWRDISTLDVSDICAAIKNDQIDILVDLAGHSANNSLKVFRIRSAPIQVAWLGYPGTTGLVEMDYRLTDAIADPDGDPDHFHSEALIRLPEGFLCYAPPPFPPEIGDPPNKINGYVTFGSFNNLLKVTPQVIDAWSVILKSVPDSRLLLKGRILNISRARENIMSSFIDRGIKEDRIELARWIQQEQSPINLYNQIDIGLDTFPYNGTTTTIEALFMGVPVVSVIGTRHSGRVGASILRTLKLHDLVAESISDYQNRAIDLAQSEERLRFYRENLRKTLDLSSLMDGPAFAEKLEAAYRKFWQDWCLS